MISSSSSNRTPGHCDAELIVDPSKQATPGTRSSVGPLRLPLKDPDSFVTRFNRIYARIGLSIRATAMPSGFPPTLDIQRETMDNELSSGEITAEALRKKACVPCEGGVPMIELEAAKAYLRSLAAWSIDDAGEKIFRKINAGNFVKAMSIMHQIAELAEAEQHHPDLHLTGYRNLRIELTTHAIGGLSENDFVVAAKIDTLL